MSEPSAQAAVAAVIVNCPHCGEAYPVREQVLGRLARCTQCGQRFVLRVAAAGEALSADKPAGPPPAVHAASPKPKAPHAAAPPLATPSPSAPAIADLTPPPPPPPTPTTGVASERGASARVSWREDTWGAASVVLAAFGLGLLLGSPLFSAGLYWPCWLAGAAACVFAKRAPVLAFAATLLAVSLTAWLLLFVAPAE